MGKRSREEVAASTPALRTSPRKRVREEDAENRPANQPVAPPRKVATRGLKLHRKRADVSNRKSALRLDPSPFASVNDFYDPHHANKFERVLTRWYTHVVHRLDDRTAALQSPSILHSSLYQNARQAIFALFDRQRPIQEAIANEIARGRFATVRDVHFAKDLGQKDVLFTLVQCYTPIWLVLGLETLTGVVASPSPLQQHQLIKEFLHQILLKSPHLNDDSPNSDVVKKFVLLIALLDEAKRDGVILPNVPLFRGDAQYKSSLAVMKRFASTYLVAEGGIKRYLGHLGITLHHVQHPLDDCDFRLTNMAKDFCDGTRLCQLVSLLSETDIMPNVVYPCAPRATKIQNVRLALKYVDCTIDPSPIVDGHREQTLSALWRIFTTLQLDGLISAKYLFDDVQTICAGEITQNAVPVPEDTFDALKQWTMAIFQKKGVACPNFGSAFADGALFCLCIHFYASDLMPPAVMTPPADVLDFGQRQAYWFPLFISAADQMTPPLPLLSLSSSFYGMACDIDAVWLVQACDCADGMVDEKIVLMQLAFLAHHLIFSSAEFEAARKIGRLCRWFVEKHRVQRYKKVIRRIERWLLKTLFRDRSHRVDKPIFNAIITIQRESRAFLVRQAHQQRRAAILHLQALLRGHRARRRFAPARSFVRFQSRCRGAVVRQQSMLAWQQIVLIQSKCLGFVQRRQLSRQRLAAALIQRVWRHVCLNRAYRHAFLLMKASTIYLQRFWRKRLTIRDALAERKLFQGRVTQFEAFARGYMVRVRVLEYRISALILQHYWRANAQLRHDRRQYRRQLYAISTLQARYRGNLARARFRELKRQRAAQVLTLYLQTFSIRIHFLAQRRAAITLQRHYRGAVNRQKASTPLKKILQRLAKQPAGAPTLLSRTRHIVQHFGRDSVHPNTVLKQCQTLQLACQYSSTCRVVVASDPKVMQRMLDILRKSVPSLLTPTLHVILSDILGLLVRSADARSAMSSRSVLLDLVTICQKQQEALPVVVPLLLVLCELCTTEENINVLAQSKDHFKQLKQCFLTVKRKASAANKSAPKKSVVAKSDPTKGVPTQKHSAEPPMDQAVQAMQSLIQSVDLCITSWKSMDRVSKQ